MFHEGYLPVCCILIDHVAFDCVAETVEIYHNCLTDQTLILGQMLDKEQYQIAIGLPSDIREIINNLVKSRNELHFICDWEFSISLRYVTDLEKLKEYVDGIFAGYNSVPLS